jgi:hypothetical protein
MGGHRAFELYMIFELVYDDRSVRLGTWPYRTAKKKVFETHAPAPFCSNHAAQDQYDGDVRGGRRRSFGPSERTMPGCCG